MTSRSHLLLLGAALSRITAAPIARATDDAAPAEQQVSKASPTLTGDWGGLRSDLRERGVDISIGYTGELATNVSGGSRKAVTETGQVTVGAAIDADKLVGLHGGSFQATVTYRWGHNLTQTAGVDMLLQVQEVYGRGQTFRLTEFSYAQQLGSGVDVKLGRLPVGNDFSSFSCDFMNGSLCGAPIGNIECRRRQKPARYCRIGCEDSDLALTKRYLSDWLRRLIEAGGVPARSCRDVWSSSDHSHGQPASAAACRTTNVLPNRSLDCTSSRSDAS